MSSTRSIRPLGDRIDGVTAKGGDPPIDLEQLRRRLRAMTDEELQRFGIAAMEQLRRRLRAMTDEELQRFGIAAERMCSSAANLGKPPRESFVIQLEEARAEWRRRKRGAK
jgi:hypothetical protein